MRTAHGICLALFVVAVLAVAGCGGGAGSTSSSRAATEPAGWKRCTNAHYGFSLAYPGSWHVASYQRLRVLGEGDAYRRKFFQHVVCSNYDPRPFTVIDGSEYPQTAVAVWRSANAREYRQAIRWTFDPLYYRTIQRQSVIVGGRQAIRYHVYVRRGLYPRSHVYGYLIDFGRRGGILIEAWRYGHKPIPWKQYRSHMALIDRMAPTARIVATS